MPKFEVWDEVAYDDAFGVVVGLRLAEEPGRVERGAYDFRVHWPNNAVTWVWDSDLENADVRRAELKWYSCPCSEDTEFDDHIRECL